MKIILLTLVLISTTLIAKNNFLENEVKTAKVNIHTQSKSSNEAIKSNNSSSASKDINRRLKHQNNSWREE